MTFDQQALFDNLVADMPSFLTKLQKQLSATVHICAVVPMEEVTGSFSVNPRSGAPLVIPWRGKYLLIHYTQVCKWDDEKQKNLGMLLVSQIIKNCLLEWENCYLEKMVYQDDLTNVFNYRRLCEDLDHQLKESHVFTLAFFDIDDLKKANEAYGHYVGSKMIKQMALKLSLELGANYQLYRYGGDEFVCLFNNQGASEVQKGLQSMMAKLEQEPFIADDGTKIPMSLSVGLAEFPLHGNTMKEIIELADNMMFCAKKSGKQKVVQPDKFKKAA